MIIKRNDVLVSVILPVYNRPEYLAQAIESVVGQDYPNWELIISDNASDTPTKELLKKFEQHPKVKIYYNSRNLGLFRNLNQAIHHSLGDYVVLLCSDDLLLPHCLSMGLSLLQQHKAEFLLSALQTLQGGRQQSVSSSQLHYDLFMKEQLKLFDSYSALELLLKYGSINGNLTGMFFAQNLYKSVGRFRECSYHTADWEWVYEAVRRHPVLLSKMPIATIRVHEKQLSAADLGNLRNSLEVAEIVKKLLDDPYLKQQSESIKWAQYIMQDHLWHGLKLALRGDMPKFLTLAQVVHQTTGLWGTFSSLLENFPRRWDAYQKKTYMLPPY
ncbi:MAG: glycosyltransferase [Tildeniella nuda ZEHNDER 1965/U140]|jgi:hypothetical protein|nr:glycosyltransferase [Tildeniella nuda ZEHNDER 1965/U140]